MNSIVYFLLTSYSLIMFLKLLGQFVMKIKNFVKYFKEVRGLEIFQNFREICKYFEVKYFIISSCISTYE